MSNYGSAKGSIWKDDSRFERKKRKTFRQKLHDYINGAYASSIMAEQTISVSTDRFNKSFEGWQIRLHKANSGHIVEAWKNDDTGPTMHSNYRRPHELFMVRDDEDMGASINDILVQLMLRG